MKNFSGRVGVIQRVLPTYRRDFFDSLASRVEGGLSVFAGEARPRESIRTTKKLKVASFTEARNLHFMAGPFYLCWQQGLKSWLRDYDPDALIIEANPRYLSSSIAIRWMKERGRPLLAWGLGASAPSNLFGQMRLKRRKAFLTDFDAILAYSQKGAMEYRSLGIPKSHVFVAPNAVVNSPNKAPIKRQNKSKATILYVGRLQKRKGLDRLLKACASLEAHMQPHCVIVGDGPESENLRSQAKQHYPQTAFRGALFGAELEKIFANADLFVLPGTGGLAIQQAMSYALPVIAAQGDGTQDDLVDQKNGWLLTSNSTHELSRVLAEALSDRNKLQAKGLASFNRVKERYNLKAMVDVFINALNEVKA